MEHQFGPLHRGGSSVDLCPSLEVMVIVIMQGILVQEVQSPEENRNLSWTPISLGALLPHPVRPMTQGLVLEGHGAQQGNARRRPQGRAPCYSPQSGWPGTHSMGNVLLSHRPHPRAAREGTRRPPFSRLSSLGTAARAPGAFHWCLWG